MSGNLPATTKAQYQSYVIRAETMLAGELTREMRVAWEMNLAAQQRNVQACETREAWEAEVAERRKLA